jgi:hypothetical protein
MLIPNALEGTATADLLKRIDEAANARGLFAKRVWNASRYGGSAVYSLWRADALLHTLDLGEAEGKTPKARSYKKLEEFLLRVEQEPVLAADDLPTQPLPGPYLLLDDHRTHLHTLGVRWDRDGKRWLAPKAKFDDAVAYLAPRKCVSLGRLTREHEAIVKAIVPETARSMNKDSYEHTVIAKYVDQVRESIKRNDTWVSLGRDFPKTANDELYTYAGARWNGSGYSVRLDDEAKAREIIEKHRRLEVEQEEKARLARLAAVAAEKAAGIIRWREGEGYGGERLPEGELVFRAPEPGAERRWYVVTECRSSYFREDGMSFGVGDDQGYVFDFVARPATDEEAAPAEAAHRARQDAFRQRAEDQERRRREAREWAATHLAGVVATPTLPEGVVVGPLVWEPALRVASDIAGTLGDDGIAYDQAVITEGVHAGAVLYRQTASHSDYDSTTYYVPPAVEEAAVRAEWERVSSRAGDAQAAAVCLIELAYRDREQAKKDAGDASAHPGLAESALVRMAEVVGAEELAALARGGDGGDGGDGGGGVCRLYAHYSNVHYHGIDEAAAAYGFKIELMTQESGANRFTGAAEGREAEREEREIRRRLPEDVVNDSQLHYSICRDTDGRRRWVRVMVFRFIDRWLPLDEVLALPPVRAVHEQGVMTPDEQRALLEARGHAGWSPRRITLFPDGRRELEATHYNAQTKLIETVTLPLPSENAPLGSDERADLGEQLIEGGARLQEREERERAERERAAARKLYQRPTLERVVSRLVLERREDDRSSSGEWAEVARAVLQHADGREEVVYTAAEGWWHRGGEDADAHETVTVHDGEAQARAAVGLPLPGANRRQQSGRRR